MESPEILDLTIKCLHKAVLEMMSFEWHHEVAKRSEAERKKASLLAIDCYNWKAKLENIQLENILAQLKQHEKELEDGIKKVNKALENLKQVKEVLDAASSLLSIVIEVAAVAAVPSAIPAASLLRAKTAFSPKMFLSEESKAMSAEFSAEEKTAIVPLEEVLYTVELTSAKLIITVDAGLNRSVEVIFRSKLNS